jgi:DNA damage-binding protein 1
LSLASHFADTVTLSLHPTPHQKQTLITNLAPISDFLVLPPSHPQADALITCSGGFGQGTLRVVRQGVGIEDYASVDFEGIRGIWTLATVVNGIDVDGPARDGVIVLRLIGRTVFLEIDGEGGLEAVESVAGLIPFEETISLKEVEGRIVQVTTERVHVTARGTTVPEFAGKVSIICRTDHKCQYPGVGGTEIDVIIPGMSDPPAMDTPRGNHLSRYPKRPHRIGIME